MDVQAPVEAEQFAPPADSDNATPALAAAQADSPAPRQRRRTFLPPPLRRPLLRATRWTHSPLALWTGSLLTAVATVAIVVAVVQVGVRGVTAPQTHYYYPNLDISSAPDESNIFPSPADNVGPPSIELPDPNDLVGSLTIQPVISDDQMAQAVLQSYDLDGAFSLEGEAPNGNDPRNGLIASFEAAYQREGSIANDVFPGLKAAFSDVAVYTDANTASTQMNDVDVNQLGLEAGLPDMVATSLDLTTVGDESRAAHLLGTAGGLQVEVVLIQFRVGGTVGVVGAAAGLGDDPNLSDQALALAQAQMRNMLGLEPPASASPSTIP